MCLLTCVTRVSNSNWLADKTLLSFTSECTGQAVGYILEEDLATLSLDNVIVFNSVETCLWILYVYVAYLLYINIAFVVTVYK